MSTSQDNSTPAASTGAGSFSFTPKDLATWQNIDQAPANPFGKDTDYEGFLDYLGALRRPLTPALAQGTLKVNLYDLNDHPDYKAAAIAALQQWSATTPMKFEIVDDRPFDRNIDYLQVVSPEVGEPNDGSAFSSGAGRLVNVGQRFHDTEPNKTDPGGYIYNTFIHEFGHEWGLNHPGFYNYGGPGGPQITYFNDAKWVYDQQKYSVMSYFNGIDTGESARWTSTTPGIADIEAVIRHYYSTVAGGVRTYQDIQLNTGDDVYGFNSNKGGGYTLASSGVAQQIGFVIHDTGGVDTIDFSGSTDSTILDLRAGRFSSVNGFRDNVAIFQGHNADSTQYYIEKGIGSAFDDIIVGNDGNNDLIGGAGNDRMDGGNGADVIHGGTGNDIIVGGLDSKDSRDRNNTLPPDNLPESRDGDDQLFGEDGDDTIDGGQGNDLLDGGAGNDILRGMAGADTFRGGDGIDTVDYSMESPFQLIVNLVTNVASGGTATGDTFDSIENLIGSDDRIDRFIGNDANNYFRGLGGGDVFNGGNGDDVLDGARDGDVLYGDAGNDRLIGGAGADYLDGGDGIDTADYTIDEQQPMFGPPRKVSTEGVTVNLATGTAKGGDGEGDTTTTHQYDRLVNIENVLGSKYADTLIGDAKVNTLWGAGGDDTLQGGGGQDTLDGGDGFDTATYYDATAGVTVDLGNPSGNPDVLVSIEGLAGSGFADQLTGDAGDNKLIGQGGDDILKGGAGNDILDGDYIPAPVSGIGMGNSYTTLGTNATNSSIAAALDLTNAFSVLADADIANATEVPHSTVNATGNGQGGFYKLTVNAGSTISLDIDRTSDGLDSYIWLVRADGTIVAQNDDAGGDPGSLARTDSSLTYKAASTGDYYIIVGQYDNDTNSVVRTVPNGATYELNVSVAPPPAPMPNIGAAGNDTLDGGAGDDILLGRAGADKLIGGDGLDTASYAGSTQAVSINLGTGAGSGGDAQGDTYNGIENAIGSLGNDKLYGTAGANVLSGDAGDDILVGGAGADTLNGGAGNDTAYYTGSRAGVIVSLATGVGSGGDAEGDTLVDVEQVIGSSFNDTLTGGAGGNSLWGGAGDDILIGGGGADRLKGEAGNDLFVYLSTGDSTAAARDTIFDFGAGDRIDLSAIDANLGAAGDQAFIFVANAAFSAVGQLRLQTVGGGVIVQGDVDGDRIADFQISVDGVSSLQASDFVL